jgi:hypothetical protein
MANNLGRALAIGSVIALLVACGSSGGGVTDGGGDGTTDGDNPFVTDGGMDGPVVVYLDGSGPCTVGTTQCTNCKDDDNDGLIDWMDPECTGPLDNDESSFATGIPGDNKDPCLQDCFFDGNSGSGDDGCKWNLACDPSSPGAPKCPYNPNAKNCGDPQSQACKNACVPLTPNGCDCFGCCEIKTADAGSVFVKLDQTCTVQTATDPTKCKPCTQVPDCLNPCDRCEICVGKPTIPLDCDGGAQGCPNNQQSCSQNVLCPNGFYCLTGCCIPQVN